MSLHGKNFLGGEISGRGVGSLRALDPVLNRQLDPPFYEATPAELDAALDAAEGAFAQYQAQPPENIARFLEAIAEHILQLGDDLIRRAQAETALPEARLTGERARTVHQVRMFAELIRDGSWVDAAIDTAVPDRKPLPKPDLRRMLIPIGPVVVFGASNFPLAFSVAGGDTISALAAGNPVVVKAHPAHPGTSELVAQAIESAVRVAAMPAGVFSMVHGVSHETGLHLVRHAATRAVGFTGSLGAGRALFDAAAARPEPIPVYAEMGSTNPVFLLPNALKANGAAIAQGLVQSVTLGVGQFCTNPGLVFGLKDATLTGFVEKLIELARAVPAGTMLYPAISKRFHQGLERARRLTGVSVAAEAPARPEAAQAGATILVTDSRTFVNEPVLLEELFGPSTLIVTCASPVELEQIARALPGQLTATLHGNESDLQAHAKLVAILRNKAGRLIFNGFPTGVEVCPAMHHGGPYPATTDAHWTSVGTAALKRCARPVCFQNFPDPSLPPELRNKNERKLWRLVDGKMTQEDLPAVASK